MVTFREDDTGLTHVCPMTARILQIRLALLSYQDFRLEFINVLYKAYRALQIWLLSGGFPYQCHQREANVVQFLSTVM